jgi:MYXO-CTERM domain-containing protein
MKRPFQLIRIGMIAGALAMVPAFAQTSSDPAASQPSGSAAAPATNPNGTGTAAGSGQTVPGTDMNSPSRTDTNNGDRGFNFGWLGLVGLAGLLGLRHHNNRVDRYDDTRNINNTGPGGIR